MKNTAKAIITALVVSQSILVSYSCSKKSSAPEGVCLTCIARSLSDNEVVKEEQVCDTAEEENFKSTFSDFSVSCH